MTVYVCLRGRDSSEARAKGQARPKLPHGTRASKLSGHGQTTAEESKQEKTRARRCNVRVMREPPGVTPSSTLPLFSTPIAHIGAVTAGKEDMDAEAAGGRLPSMAASAPCAPAEQGRGSRSGAGTGRMNVDSAAGLAGHRRGDILPAPRWRARTGSTIRGLLGGFHHNRTVDSHVRAGWCQGV